MALRPLAARHRATVRAIGEALFEHDDGPRPEQLDALVDDYAAHVGVVSPALRQILLFTLDFVRWLPIVLFAAAGSFETLPRGARARLLERMEKSKALPLSLAFVAHKTLLTMIFFEKPEELRAMGYPGPERKRWSQAAA